MTTLTATRDATQLKELNLPSADQAGRYACHYWAGTLGNLLTHHRLHGDVARRYATDFQLTPRLRRRWQQFFEQQPAAGANTITTPFLYSQSVGTLVYTRLFADLGLNFRYLLHLHHHTDHPAGTEAYLDAEHQRLDCGVIEVRALEKDRALVVLETLIEDTGGRRIARVEDSFMIRGLMPEILAALPIPTPHAPTFRGLSHLKPTLGAEADQHPPLDIRADTARGFGRISGDRNPVHTTPLAARLFGFRQPFVQGLCLRNLVMQGLSRPERPVSRLDITFARPACAGQPLSLLSQGERYEVIDPDNRLIARGSHHSSA